MGRKSKLESGEEMTEPTSTSEDATLTDDITLLLKFEDLTIKQKSIIQQDGTSGSVSYLTIIDKKTGGISDHTYNMFASGEQKNWYLCKENEPVIDTGSQRGNRPFHWEGTLLSGLYTLGTGPAQNYNNPRKYRVPGRGYQVKFRL